MSSATDRPGLRNRNPVPERTLASRLAFSGRLLKVEVLDVELEPGVRAVREVIRHPGAAAVIAECPDKRFVMVRQFRKPAEQALLEIVAGGLEPDESPETCARREVLEESGHEVLAIRRLGSIYPTPGYNSELIHLFHANVSAERAVHHKGDHDERIGVEYVTRAEMQSLIRKGVILDAKTLSAWLLFTLPQEYHCDAPAK